MRYRLVDFRFFESLLCACQKHIIKIAFLNYQQENCSFLRHFQNPFLIHIHRQELYLCFTYQAPGFQFTDHLSVDSLLSMLSAQNHAFSSPYLFHNVLTKHFIIS